MYHLFDYFQVNKEDFDLNISSDVSAKTVDNFDVRFNCLLVELLEKIKDYSKERNKLGSLISRLVSIAYIFGCFYMNFITQLVTRSWCMLNIFQSDLSN